VEKASISKEVRSDIKITSKKGAFEADETKGTLPYLLQGIRVVNHQMGKPLRRNPQPKPGQENLEVLIRVETTSQVLQLTMTIPKKNRSGETELDREPEREEDVLTPKA